MQNEVKECLQAEKEMCQLIEQISHSDTRTESMKIIIQYIPCIMHCKNMLPIKGISNAQGNLLGGMDKLSFKEREASYIESMNKIISESLLGSEGNDAQFSVPLVDKKDVQGHQIGTITMENYCMQKIIDGLDQLIDISIVNTNEEEDQK